MTQDVGSTYRASLSVTDATGAPVNPATATLTITLPDQTTAAPAVTLPPAVTGTLIEDYVLAQEGLHRFAWTTTAPGTTLTDYVNARAYVALCPLAEVREYLAINDRTQDRLLRSAMGAAAKLVEDMCGTCVIRPFTDDWITGDMRDVIRLPHGPLPAQASFTSLTSVYPGGPAWANADVIVNPEHSTLRLKSFMPFWFGPWRANYTGGRTIIPEPMIHGYKEILWDMWAVLRGVQGDQQYPDLAEASQFQQSEMAGILPPANYRIPARAAMFLEEYRQPGFG